jgi:hypothetical protein
MVRAYVEHNYDCIPSRNNGRVQVKGKSRAMAMSVMARIELVKE